MQLSAVRVNRCQPAKPLFESSHGLMFPDGGGGQMGGGPCNVRVPEPTLNRRERDSPHYAALETGESKRLLGGKR
jgi:hypothetical protein